MGTPEFAVATLSHLLQHGFPVVGVITAPDKPAGRGQKMRASAVKIFAQEKGLHILQPRNLKDPGFLSELEKLRADIQIVVAFRMLPRAVWEMPTLGTINLHASLLPDYRGAAPINWAIMNGETQSGVTTFYINDRIDTGAILLQEAVSIELEDTAGDLHDRLMVQGAHLVAKTIRGVMDKSLFAMKQDESRSVHKAPKLNPANCRIDWSLPATEIYNHVRGLSPYPGAWTQLIRGKEITKIKVYACTPIPDEHNHTIGSLIKEKSSIKVAVSDGFLELVEIQLPGKRRMWVKHLIHGLRIENDAQLR